MDPIFIFFYTKNGVCQGRNGLENSFHSLLRDKTVYFSLNALLKTLTYFFHESEKICISDKRKDANSILTHQLIIFCDSKIRMNL